MSSEQTIELISCETLASQYGCKQRTLFGSVTRKQLVKNSEDLVCVVVNC
jgi:predicted nucleotidyltransferase